MVNESTKIEFGTDGWRDVIADGFTFANLRRAARAYADHLQEQAHGGPVLVGYDTRFLGRNFALEVAGVLRSQGLTALVSTEFLPTPALSFAVKHLGAAGGVMLTASHNPPEYSGFKLKGPYGGTATDEIYRDVARRVTPDAVAAPGSGGSVIDEFDIRADYYRALAALVDLDALADADLTLLHDPMGGAGCGWLKGFATATGSLRVEETRGRPDPAFHGVNPEPIAVNLEPTRELLRVPEGRVGSGPAFAVATDGDADRLGVVLPGGAFFNSHQIFAVLLDQLSRSGPPEGAAAGTPGAGTPGAGTPSAGTRTPRVGTVVKTFTVSRIIERLARARGLVVQETPVGFKFIVEAMLTGQSSHPVLIGGEESGGIGVGRHLPERDGIANALLLAEAVVTSGESLAKIFARLENEADWRHAYDRSDLHLTHAGVKERVMKRLADPPAEFGGWRLESVEDLDGVKLNLARGGVSEPTAEPTAWLLFRPSGTEPVLRLYCEAPDDDAVAQILAAAERFVEAA